MNSDWTLERPEWLTLPAPEAQSLAAMQQRLAAGHLHTVCESADCPNIGECFSQNTCTFMILGDVCTRNCRYCAVSHGYPLPVDANESQSVAAAVGQLGLKHVVITSVSRDDLADGGASHFAATILAVRAHLPTIGIEVLIPDLQGDADALAQVVNAAPEIIGHNLETVPRLYPTVRPQASYRRSLAVLARVKATSDKIITKSSLMLGLGEGEAEVHSVLRDLRAVGCQMLNLGQYLRPSLSHLPVKEYIHPAVFENYAMFAYELGFAQVSAGPLVRSSYRAAAAYGEISGR